jgi:hypothetical protein
MKNFRMKIKTNLEYIQFAPHRGEHHCCDENDTFPTIMCINLAHNLIRVHWYYERRVVEVIKRSLIFPH